MISRSTHKHITSTLILSLTILTILSGIILSASSASADSSASVNVSVTVPSVCSLTASPESVSNTIYPGHDDTIGTTNIKAICNDPAGLAVYAVGYTDSTYGNTDLVSTVGGTTNVIHTNVTTSGTPQQSEWNMTINAVSGTYAPTIVSTFEDTANAIPATYTKVAYRNTMTDMGENANGANFTAAFDAYIAENQAAGTYTGKVKFLLVHPHVLTYDSQTGQPDEVQPSTFTLDPEAIIGGCSANSPILQNVSSWGSSVALGETIDAIDSRDNQCYKVKRLKMNSAGTETALWMSNLNLGAEALTVTRLDNTNTNLPNDSTKFIATSDFMSWNRTISGNSDSYTSPKYTPVTAANSSIGQAEDYYGNKYGTLYNYTAVSAGTYAYARNTSNGDAVYDLCPSGWRMPTGDSSGEFKDLIIAYSLINNDNGSMVTLLETLGFSLAGGFYNSAPNDQEYGGYYWSSSLEYDHYMYTFYLYWGYIDTYGQSRNDGLSVRCIAQ